ATADAAMARSLAFYMDKGYPAGVIDFEHGSLWPYINNNNASTGARQAVFQCPSDTDYRHVRWGSDQGTKLAHARNFSYSFNWITRFAVPWDGSHPQTYFCNKASNVRQSSSKCIVIDEQSPNDGMCALTVDDADDQLT